MKPVQNFLSRGRVNKILNALLLYPLSMISAPMGYGKTMAVRDFFKQKRIDPVWVSLMAVNGTAAHFWDRLTIQIGLQNNELGLALNSLGFPIDAPQRTKIIDMLFAEEFSEPFVIVLDDFHLVAEPDVFEFINLIIRHEIKNLNIVIITRDADMLDITNLGRLCTLIPQETLCFTDAEIEQYFTLMDIKTNSSFAVDVAVYTGGWIAVLYLVMLGLKNGTPLQYEGRMIQNMESINDLVERNLYQHYDNDTKEILRRLALMGTFTAKRAGYVLNRDDMDGILRKLCKKNALIAYNESDRTYQIHNVLIGFLYERAALPETEKSPIYHRIAEWYMDQKLYFEAFVAYRNAGEPEAVLSIASDLNRPFIPHALQINFFDLYENQPPQVWRSYPLAFIDYASNLILSGDETLSTQGREILNDLTDYYTNNEEVNQNYRNSILAEIHVCRIFTVFNDADRMIFHMNEAARLLQGGYSALVRRKDEFTFGCPHFLYEYHREVGKLKETVDKMVASFGGFADIASGCGAGCHYLTAAEYALETMDFEMAELNAFKAMYTANTKEQISVAACAYFVLIRLNLYKGKYREAYEYLDRLAEDITKENNPILNTTLDLITGYFYGMTGMEERIPDWLRNGDMSAAAFMYQGMAWNYVVYEKALLLQEDYILLDVICGEYTAAFDIFNNQLGYLHNHIHRSVAKYHTEGETTAVTELRKGIAIGQADGILFPFAENWRHVLPILETIREADCGEGKEYIERLIHACTHYKKNNPMPFGMKVLLSYREREVLLFLADGLSRDEIANKMFITISTVKKHIESIYRKLQTNNRAKAVKRAVEIGLI